MQRRVEELTRKLEAARASKLRERDRTTAAKHELAAANRLWTRSGWRCEQSGWPERFLRAKLSPRGSESPSWR